MHGAADAEGLRGWTSNVGTAARVHTNSANREVLLIGGKSAPRNSDGSPTCISYFIYRRECCDTAHCAVVADVGVTVGSVPAL